MSVKAGSTYIIVNVQGGSAADFTGDRTRDVRGYPIKKTSSQRWTLEDAGEGFFRIRNGTGKYLSFSGDLKKGTQMICSAHQQTWKITADDKHPNDIGYHRVLYPGTNFYLDLANGKSAPGTPILLWEKDSGKNQAWFFNSP